MSRSRAMTGPLGDAAPLRINHIPQTGPEHGSEQPLGFFVRIGRARHVGYRIVHGDHWLWEGALDDNGYGTAWSRRRGKVAKAHQVIWEYSRGPIPNGLEIDHVCRVRRCVNPDHLELVTHTENMRRARRASCRQGHPYTSANTYLWRGKRWCRTCLRLYQRRYQADYRVVA